MVDTRAMVVSISVVLVGMLVIFVQYRYITAGTNRYLHSLGDQVHALQTEASIDHPLALLVVNAGGEIVWYNKKGEELLGGSAEQFYGRMVADFIGSVDYRQPTPEKGFPVKVSGRMYSLYANESAAREGEETLYALYLVDDNDLKHYTDLYFKTRPAVMRIMVDNYDELAQSARESDRTQVLSEITAPRCSRRSNTRSPNLPRNTAASSVRWKRTATMWSLRTRICSASSRTAWLISESTWVRSLSRALWASSS